MKTKRTRLLALVLAAAMLLALTPVYAAKTAFTDVPEGSWYEDAVAALAGNGCIKGVSDTQFDPGGTMTRAMVVTILSRMGGGKSPDGACSFRDVPADAWYAQPVAWAEKNGVTMGVDKEHFAPNLSVTREQFVTLMWRYAELRYENDFDRFFDAEAVFSDEDPVSSWAQDAMRLAVGAGIVKGRDTPSGIRIAAEDTCTRAEAATMLYRFSALDLTDKEARTEPLSEAELNTLADRSLALFCAMHTPGKNSVTSPLSALCALGMLYQGASGETAAQMKTFFDASAPDVADMLSALTDALASENSTVRIANALFVRKGEPIRPQFLAINRDKLDAEIFQRDFGPETLKELNDWANEKTDGMIPSILDDLPSDSILVLLNALLFKGHWSELYTGTQSRDFHAANGQTQKADMLYSQEYIYLHDDNAAGFLKPFERGDYAFAVIVPNEGMTPEEYLATLDGTAMRKLLTGERYDEVHAGMPKFKAEASFNLMNAFPKIGLTNLNELENLSPDAFVSQAVQKAVIDVNESGVSAAAVTAIVAAKSAMPVKVATVIADRPYVYMIVNTETNLPLFIGIVESVA